jgi:hypothetical protein
LLIKAPNKCSLILILMKIHHTLCFHNIVFTSFQISCTVFTGEV